MYWILESNLMDFGYQVLIKTLERKKIPFLLVKVVPYTSILVSPDFDTFAKQPEEKDNIYIDDNQKIFVFGTMGLPRIANERNWYPGSLNSSEFDFEKWSQGFGFHNLLNEKSKIMKFSDEINVDYNPFFIRPCEDNKAFSGQVINKQQFKEWQSVIANINDERSKLNNETMITVAPCQEIIKEARMFVFNGKYVTGSYYKFGLKVRYEEVSDNDPIIDYTNEVVSHYQPAKAFVIDIALTDNGYKIIEINNINSVGLYNANVEKFVDAVMKL